MNSPARATFVVGTGRCGSTMLSAMLRAHPAVLSLSEVFTLAGPALLPRLREQLDGKAFWKLLSTPSDDLRALLRVAESLPELLVPPHSLAHEDGLHPWLLIPLPHLSSQPEQLLRELALVCHARRVTTVLEHLGQVFEWLRVRLARELWIERSGGSLEYVDALLDGWPGAKLVHLIRDGRAVAYSMSRHPYFRVKLARHLACDPALSVAECLRAEIPLDRFAVYWSALMLRGQSALERVRDRVLVVRYESLVTRPSEQLARLAAFLQVARDERWLRLAEGAAEPRPDPWRSLPQSTRSRLERACLPGLRLTDRLAA